MMAAASVSHDTATTVAAVTVELRDEHAVPIVEVVEWNRQDLRSTRVQRRCASPSASIER